MSLLTEAAATAVVTATAAAAATSDASDSVSSYRLSLFARRSLGRLKCCC